MMYAIFKIFRNLFRKKPMADFSSLDLDSSKESIPYNTSGVEENGLGLSNPDSMLSGQLRGTQFAGSPTLQIDSTKNIITVKGTPVATGTSVLRVGQVSPGYLGLAVGANDMDTLFAGQDPSGVISVKIAKPGFDVKTAGPNDLIFNSNQNIFKIVKVVDITVTLPISATSQIITQAVPHGLGYTPAFLAFHTVPNDVVALFPQTVGLNPNPTDFYILPGGTGSLSNILHCATSIDSTNVYFSVMYGGSIAGSPYVFTSKCYLLQETAN